MKLVTNYSEKKGNLADIRKLAVSAICEYQMIEKGDKVLVAVSGGKDSGVLAWILRDIQKKSPIPFEFECVLVNQNHPDVSYDKFLGWMEEKGFPVTVLSEPIWDIVLEKKGTKSPCSICARMRRGTLYTYAKKKGFTKIALGHNRDDLVTTLMLNFFYGGSLASMPPKLISNDKKNTVIRPICNVPEDWLSESARFLEMPVQTCTLCEYGRDPKRKKMKKIFASLEKENPLVGVSAIKAITNVKASQLADKNIFPFLQDKTN